MRARLFVEDSQLTNTQQKNSSMRQTPTILYDRKKQYERPGSMNSSISTQKTPKSRQWQRTLTTLAAVLTIALILGSLVFTLNAIHRPSLTTKPTSVAIPAATGTPAVTTTPTPKPALPHMPTRVTAIHMLDSSIGWVTCED